MSSSRARVCDVSAPTLRELIPPSYGGIPPQLQKRQRVGQLQRQSNPPQIAAPELDEVASRRLRNELLGPDGLTAQVSVFRRRDVIREISDRLPDGAPAETIQQLAEQLLHSPKIVALTGPEGAADTMSRFDERLVFTTIDLLRLEERVVTLADQGRRTGLGRVEAATLAGIVHHATALAPEQRLMINRLCRSGNLIDTVVGVPGAGKTRSLAVAHEPWRAAGHPVVGCSVKATAAAELQAPASPPPQLPGYSWTLTGSTRGPGNPPDSRPALFSS